MYQFLRGDVGHHAPNWRRSSSRRDRTPRRAPRDTRRRTPTSGSRPRVVAYTSRRDGHVTRRISLRTSVKNVRLLSHQPRMPPSVVLTGAGLTCSRVLIRCHPERRRPSRPAFAAWQVRRDSNPQPPVLETGALPIELLTYSTSGLGSGFSALTDAEPRPEPEALFRLLVRRVLPAEATELAELEPLGRLLLVLRRAVVPALAVAARQ